MPLLPPRFRFVCPTFTNEWILYATVAELLVGIGTVILGLYFASWISQPDEWTHGPVEPHQYHGACLYTFVYPFGFMLTMDAIGRVATFRDLIPILRHLTLALFGLACVAGLVLCIFLLSFFFFTRNADWSRKTLVPL